MKEFFDITSWLGLPKDISTHGAGLDYMTGIVHILMAVLFIGWGGFFIYSLFRFRASKNPRADYKGATGHLSTYQEGAIVLAEVLLLFVFALPAWASLKNDFPTAEETMEINVVGEQFAWNFHHAGPDGQFGRRSIDFVDTATNPVGLDLNDPAGQDDIITVNEMHIPMNTPIVVNISSKDVIHSFSLPNLRVKQDAIPGLTIPVWFEATETGRYDIGCAQLCGLGHYRMHGWLNVHTQADYDAWVQTYLEELEEFGR